MKQDWAAILTEKEVLPTPVLTPRLGGNLATEQPLLAQLCRELAGAQISAALEAGQNKEAPTHYKLSREYIFIAQLGTKAPFKKGVFAGIGVSSTPEVVIIKFPGRRTTGVAVGYCSQYDSEVFFGGDGRIYLVDFDQIKVTLAAEGAMKVYESDEMLDSDWRTFGNICCRN